MTYADTLALQVAGRLLAYPDASFFAGLPELRREAENHVRIYPEAEAFIQEVLTFVDRMETAGQPGAAEQYVSIFDLASSCSLYMTWHRYGNDRGQGQALAALNGLYRLYGFEPEPGALPDYLPRMLEFMAFAPAAGVEVMLDGFGPEIKQLAANLKTFHSPHASMLAAALIPLQREFPEKFADRKGADPTRRPMAQPEPEPFGPLIASRDGESICQSRSCKNENCLHLNHQLNHDQLCSFRNEPTRNSGEKDE